jgi:hypothetical protein
MNGNDKSLFPRDMFEYHPKYECCVHQGLIHVAASESIMNQCNELGFFVPTKEKTNKQTKDKINIEMKK